MRRSQAVIVVLLASAAVSCATASDRGVFSLVEGQWGWAEGELSCDRNPHTLGFSRDRSRMTLRHEKSTLLFDGRITDQVVYHVIDHSPHWIEVFVDGETRRTSTGQLVHWHLLLLSDDEYCWHRSDWPGTGCTERVVRCQAVR